MVIYLSIIFITTKLFIVDFFLTYLKKKYSVKNNTFNGFFIIKINNITAILHNIIYFNFGIQLYL